MTGSSSSTTPAAPASLPQDSVIPTRRPVSTRSESTSSQAWGDPSPEPTRSESTSSQARGDMSPEPTETEKTIKNEDNENVRVQNGYKNSQRNLVNERVPVNRVAPAISSRESDSEPLRKVYRTSTVLYSLPEGPKLRHLHEDQDNQDSLQKAHWRSHASSRTIWWLDNSRSHSSQWRMWISKQSSICCRGTGFGNSINSIIHVQNKNFSGNRKEPSKVLGADGKTQSHLHCQFPRIWQGLWRPILESLYVNTSPLARRVKEGPSALLLQSGLDENWQIPRSAILYLSAKHSRSRVWWEDTLRTAIRRTIERTNNSIWFDDRISHHVCQSPVNTPPVQ